MFTFSIVPGEACDATTAAVAVELNHGTNSAFQDHFSPSRDGRRSTVIIVTAS
jgi:hypothetical protein